MWISDWLVAHHQSNGSASAPGIVFPDACAAAAHAFAQDLHFG